MEKVAIDARKLANKIVANCMESPLPLAVCMNVLATIMVDYAMQHGYSMDDVLEDVEDIYKLRLFANAEKSGEVH